MKVFDFLNRRCFQRLSALFMIVVLVILSFSSCYDGERLTCDIADYNTEEYPLHAPFPETIPENAEVVKFVWYDYWHEKRDKYLELRFDSEIALQDFLNERLTATSNRLDTTENYRPSDGDWFFTTENPYDDSFIDCFCKAEYVWSGDKRYVGYEVEIGTSGDYWYRCYYGMISYSLSSRTLIITYASGTFRDGFHNTPGYFERFSVPNEPVDRLTPVELIFPAD